jgi:hypothetical protein
MMGGKRSSDGEVSLVNAGSKLDVSVPLQLPEKYPSNRTLVVSVLDEATGAVVTSASRKLEEGTLETGSDGSSVVKLSIPAIQRPGNYRLDGKLISDVPNEKGGTYALPSPVACDTGAAQPPKARSCRLLTLHVQPH